MAFSRATDLIGIPIIPKNALHFANILSPVSSKIRDQLTRQSAKNNKHIKGQLVSTEL